MLPIDTVHHLLVAAAKEVLELLCDFNGFGHLTFSSNRKLAVELAW